MLQSIKGILNSPTKTTVAPTEVLNSGSEILTHFQNNWFELHELNETNAKKASELAEVISSLHSKIERDNIAVNSILLILNTPNGFHNVLDNCFEQITNLHKSLESVEESLLELEKLVELCDLEKKKNDHRKELELYKEKKMANLEVFRSNLAKEHAKNILDHEIKEKLKLEERQKVFQEAFKDDLEVYKNLGAIPRINILSSQPSALLEEIQLDLDNDELDDFLREN